MLRVSRNLHLIIDGKSVLITAADRTNQLRFSSKNLEKSAQFFSQHDYQNLIILPNFIKYRLENNNFSHAQIKYLPSEYLISEWAQEDKISQHDPNLTRVVKSEPGSEISNFCDQLEILLMARELETAVVSNLLDEKFLLEQMNYKLNTINRLNPFAELRIQTVENLVKIVDDKIINFDFIEGKFYPVKMEGKVGQNQNPQPQPFLDFEQIFPKNHKFENLKNSSLLGSRKYNWLVNDTV